MGWGLGGGRDIAGEGRSSGGSTGSPSPHPHKRRAWKGMEAVEVALSQVGEMGV